MNCYDIINFGGQALTVFIILWIISIIGVIATKNSSSSLTRILFTEKIWEKETKEQAQRRKVRTVAQRRKTRVGLAIFSLVFVVMTVLSFEMIIVNNIVFTAASKGADDNLLKSVAVTDVMSLSENNKTAPMDESKKGLQYYRENKINNNNIIIFYRYDCEACAQWGSKIEEYFATKDIIWCSTRTASGKELLDKLRYNEGLTIDSVPTMVCCDKMEYKVYELISGDDDNARIEPTLVKGE